MLPVSNSRMSSSVISLLISKSISGIGPVPTSFRHSQVETLTDFLDSLKSGHKEGVRVIEIRLDRKRDAQRRKQWFQEIVDALGAV